MLVMFDQDSFFNKGEMTSTVTVERTPYCKKQLEINISLLPLWAEYCSFIAQKQDCLCAGGRAQLTQ